MNSRMASINHTVTNEGEDGDLVNQSDAVDGEVGWLVDALGSLNRSRSYQYAETLNTISFLDKEDCDDDHQVFIFADKAFSILSISSFFIGPRYPYLWVLISQTRYNTLCRLN